VSGNAVASAADRRQQRWLAENASITLVETFSTNAPTRNSVVKEVKPLGNAGRIQARKRYIGNQELVIILKQD
jgi:putative transposon-encoded protein